MRTFPPRMRDVRPLEPAAFAYAQINHEQFHRMLDEYREAKRRELDLELKAKQCVLMASLRLPQNAAL